MIPSPTCMVLRRDLAVEIGGFEEEFRRGFYDDQVFTVKMSLAAPIILQKGYYEKYRQHKDSITYISENITGEGERMRKVFLNWMKKYMLGLGVKATWLSIVLEKELLLDRYPHVLHLLKTASRVKDRIVRKLYTRSRVRLPG